jgi:hypothetical protein
MFGLYIRRTELVSLIPREVDDTRCLFCIALEHFKKLYAPSGAQETPPRSCQ